MGLQGVAKAAAGGLLLLAILLVEFVIMFLGHNMITWVTILKTALIGFVLIAVWCMIHKE
jgi:hypothetical protein